MKKLLFMVSHPPYRDSHVAELLDAAMVGAVFDCDVSLLFRGTGVRALQSHQDAEVIKQRTVGKILQALDTYDINKVFVCAHALEEAGLAANELAITAQAIDFDTQAKLISAQDAVLGAQS